MQLFFKTKEKKTYDASAQVQAISEIVAHLISAVENGKDVNVKQLKTHYAWKNNLPDTPKTVDIIAAIPDQYKETLSALLKTKPIRTASGVRI